MIGAYRINGWGQAGTYYEVAQNKRTAGALPWVAISTKHDGKKFRRLGQMPNSAALYGAWMLIVQVAAKCPVRGLLADEDGPLTPDDLALKTGFPAESFDEALKALSSPDLGFLCLVSVTDAKQAVELRNETERDGTERNEDSPIGESFTETQSVASAVMKFPCDGPVKTYLLTQSKLDEYAKAYPNIDVLAECRKALQWCNDNPGRRKTAAGLPAFLGRWLGKVTNQRSDGTAKASKYRPVSELLK